jgi:hypothetical protein
MSEQPPSVLFEAARLVDTLRRRIGEDAGDVWAEATREHTGAPECRYCPVCRAIAASRTSGPDVVSHVMAAGESLYAAVREAVAGFEQTRPPRREPGDEPADGGRPQGD